MQKNQKYFAVCDANGQLLPYFIAVSSFHLQYNIYMLLFYLLSVEWNGVFFRLQMVHLMKLPWGKEMKLCSGIIKF
jgi:hypothetical protein